MDNPIDHPIMNMRLVALSTATVLVFIVASVVIALLVWPPHRSAGHPQIVIDAPIDASGKRLW